MNTNRTQINEAMDSCSNRSFSEALGWRNIAFLERLWTLVARPAFAMSFAGKVNYCIEVVCQQRPVKMTFEVLNEALDARNGQ
ncbi:hypothetical protein [Marinobacter sp. BW6]|uniref:hypothetical protein n=1 Tax=Marinobacter sp. BW6 TaxID=2592624 RepID=UPI001F07753E|nr:hypothetical protein [Marinobacter sp. BW6]